jgi:hypothetical protein
MTPELDLSSWPSKPEAAKLLGIGERTLDRMVKLKGYPEVRMRPRDGRKPEPVVHPEDVKFMLAGRRVTTVMPANSSPSGALAVRSSEPPDLVRALEALATISDGRPADALWLTLKQAAQYSGLSMALLQRLAVAGRVLSVKDNGWKFQRAALDELGENVKPFWTGNKRA